MPSAEIYQEDLAKISKEEKAERLNAEITHDKRVNEFAKKFVETYMQDKYEAIPEDVRHRLKLLSPAPYRLKPSRARFRQAVQRCRAIRERLMGDPIAHPAVASLAL